MATAATPAREPGGERPEQRRTPAFRQLGQLAQQIACLLLSSALLLHDAPHNPANDAARGGGRVEPLREAMMRRASCQPVATSSLSHGPNRDTELAPSNSSCKPGHRADEAGAPPTGTPRHPEAMRNSNSGRSHGTAGGFANAVPVRTAPTRW